MSLFSNTRVIAFGLMNLLATAAFAGDIKAYNAQEFDRLTHDGKAVVVDVAASWCPTCRAQKPVIEKVAKTSAYKDVTVLDVDFDHDKAARQRFHVHSQSTLIAFNGEHEVARSIGDTTSDGIEHLFQQATQK